MAQQQDPYLVPAGAANCNNATVNAWIANIPGGMTNVVTNICDHDNEQHAEQVFNMIKWIFENRHAKALVNPKHVERLETKQQWANDILRAQMPREEQKKQALAKVMANRGDKNQDLVESVLFKLGVDAAGVKKLKDAKSLKDDNRTFLFVLGEVYDCPGLLSDFLDFLAKGAAHVFCEEYPTVKFRVIILATASKLHPTSKVYEYITTTLGTKVALEEWANKEKSSDEEAVLAYLVALYFCCASHHLPLTLSEMVVYLMNPENVMHRNLEIATIKEYCTEKLKCGITPLQSVQARLRQYETHLPADFDTGAMTKPGKWPDLVQQALRPATNLGDLRIEATSGESETNSILNGPHTSITRAGGRADSAAGSTAAPTMKSTKSRTTAVGRHQNAESMQLVQKLSPITNEAERLQAFAKLSWGQKRRLGSGTCSLCGHDYGEDHFHQPGQECPVYKTHPMAASVHSLPMQYPVYVRLGWAQKQPESEKRQP
uniref:Uncharacterized protein n=1 Tax=Neobodo designis TaxID=312471 RepID=A0A7S1QAG5_NEODS|mmetsp:Transcript_36695/g.113105  ORF Transcript_36695/g.113105 Transcript_36695/m.113105 type:complete len:489 (+) Transcript_36695:29-1495(+)|eukprot:CAMPEP_0174849640 /NCGR_PEP_ID=MMETSP1114-20130205/16677_1 /TAXON_ID=312471 /ORGANISM="Neobodo designis, Strain CCAP 1951/1" /LENGTH=488 /DNA_ID=CAMNT_0016084017 /DNA_START=28 /DNA_END=1494 /DNA_ORIENTATION=-